MEIPFNEKITINNQSLPFISQFAEFIPGGFFIYRNDESEEIIYFSSKMADLLRCKTDSEFIEFTGNSFKGIIHPDDHNNYQESVKAKSTSENHDKEHIRYRTVRKDGSTGMFESSVRLSRSDDFGEICCVFVHDISEQYNAELKKETDKKLSEYNYVNKMFSGTYTAICLVNIEKNEYKVMSMNGETERLIKKYVPPSSKMFETAMGLMPAIHEDYQEKYKYIIENVYNILETNNGFYQTSVKWKYEDEEYYLTEINLYRDPEDKNIIVAGFRNIHDAESQTKAISDCVNIFTDNEDNMESLNKMLTIISDYYKADRAYVFEDTDSGDMVSNTYEWCADGITSEKENLQNIPKKVCEVWYKAFEKEGAFSIDSMTADNAGCEEAKSILEMQGINSLIAAPIYYQDKIFGFIGVDNPHYAKMDTRVLTNAASLTSNLIIKKRQKELENKERLEKKKNTEIIEILASEYTSVYYVDLKKDYFKAYTMNKATAIALDMIYTDGMPYSEAFRIYVEKLVHPDDKELMLEAGSIENIMKELKIRKTFITTYRNINGQYFEMKFVKVGNEAGIPTAAALAYADKDAEIRANMKREAISARDASVIAGLSTDYGCVYYADYDTKEEIHYRFDPFFEKNIPGWSKINRFDDRLETLINTIMHPDDRKFFRTATAASVIKKELEKEKVYYVNFRVLINDEVTYYQAKFVQDENTENHVIAGFRNVDDETRRELAALDKAEAANRAKTAFLFNMSHDIRTPMNAIIGYTNIAKKNINDPEKVLESLEKVKLSSDMLLALINDILDMSRIESGKAVLKEEKADIVQIFSNIEPVMSSLANSKNINLSFSIGEIKDRFVYVDTARLERILVNIISNGIKYTLVNGFVKVSVKQNQSFCSGYELYTFEVEDNGIGMSEEFQKEMFEEFSREENFTTSGIQGTGLGLPLAKKLTRMMGGTISCVSKQGKGSVFTICIPFRLQKDSDINKLESENIKSGKISYVGRKVLLVEDNDLNCEIAADILEGEGMTVTRAENGLKSLEILESYGDQYFDFILMDIQMPVMDGYTATKEIRKRFPDLIAPVIALSANAFEEDRLKSLEAGMNDHVAKPISIEDLKASLERF